MGPLPPTDRVIAWLFALLGGSAAVLGGLAGAFGLLANRGAGEGAILIGVAGFALLIVCGPGAVGSVAILRGTHSGYWGWVASGVVVLLATALSMRRNLYVPLVLPLVLFVGPTALGARRLREGAPSRLGTGSGTGLASTPRGLTLRGLGLGELVLGGTVAVRGAATLVWQGVGPPVPLEAGDGMRMFLFGGGGHMIAGALLIAGGALALLRVRVGVGLGFVGLALLVGPYVGGFGLIGLPLLALAGFVAWRAVGEATR